MFLHAGCNASCGTNNATETTSSSSGSTVSAGGGPACYGGAPDGECIGNGPQQESCDCPDCAASARCNGRCNDDDNCQYSTDQENPGEDCSCADCYLIVNECVPQVGDCTNGEGEDGCEVGEPCTCADCTDTAFCTDNCVNDGVCVSAYEGCSCADCAGQCGNPVTTSSTTTTTGAGGMGSGGMGAAGGMGGAGAAGGMSGAGGGGGA
ncbi:MAG: hypothetical protein KC731_19640 [Myxococcales bacterium]|nr:hypothetical protein [Myxococcales bacterium]